MHRARFPIKILLIKSGFFKAF